MAASKDPSKIETLKIDYNDLDFTDPACVTLGVTSSNVIMKVIIPGIQNRLYFVMNEDEVIAGNVVAATANGLIKQFKAAEIKSSTNKIEDWQTGENRSLTGICSCQL